MKNLRTSVLKESIADFTNIANSIKENTSATVQALLREAVAQEYVKIMSEGFDKDEEEIEIKDTEAEDAPTDAADSAEVEGEESDFETDVEDTDDETDFEGSEEDVEMDEEESTPEDWAEFDDYKVDGVDGQYDFSKADDETIVKVYKLLKNSDEVIVDVDNDKNKLELKDNQTGAEYLIDLDSICCGNDSCDMEDDEEFEDDAYSVEEFEDNDDINESKMVEIVLSEDTNLGYTDSYQKTDVLTTPSMKEPGRNVNDWDAGVPKGKEKPWAGKGTPKKGTPFCEEDEMSDDAMAMEDEMMDGDAIEECNVPVKDASNWGLDHKAKKGNKVPVKGASDWGTKGLEECGDMTMEEGDDLEEANLSQSRWNDTHAAHNRVPAANKDSYRRDGMQKTSKGATYRANGGSMDEAIIKKHKQIVAENKKMKATLNELHKLVAEAAVTNMNLGQIVKLLNENSTTQDEKREIIARFGKEAKTINESKELYAKISRELQKKSVMNINEDKQFTTENSNKINENTIYASKDLMASLDLMHKICK